MKRQDKWYIAIKVNCFEVSRDLHMLYPYTITCLISHCTTSEYSSEQCGTL